jgi:hypothetical protein
MPLRGQCCVPGSSNVMPQRIKSVGWSDLIFAWVNAVVFAFTAIWGAVQGSGEFPLPGFRSIAGSPLMAWLLALFVSYVAIQLSVARLRTREALLFTSGALACAWLVLVIYVSPGPAISLGLLSGLLYRNGTRAEA